MILMVSEFEVSLFLSRINSNLCLLKHHGNNHSGKDDEVQRERKF